MTGDGRLSHTQSSLMLLMTSPSFFAQSGLSVAIQLWFGRATFPSAWPRKELARQEVCQRFASLWESKNLGDLLCRSGPEEKRGRRCSCNNHLIWACRIPFGAAPAVDSLLRGSPAGSPVGCAGMMRCRAALNRNSCLRGKDGMATSLLRAWSRRASLQSADGRWRRGSAI